MYECPHARKMIICVRCLLFFFRWVGGLSKTVSWISCLSVSIDLLSLTRQRARDDPHLKKNVPPSMFPCVLVNHHNSRSTGSNSHHGPELCLCGPRLFIVYCRFFFGGGVVIIWQQLVAWWRSNSVTVDGG